VGLLLVWSVNWTVRGWSPARGVPLNAATGIFSNTVIAVVVAFDPAGFGTGSVTAYVPGVV
jgi:hypothetical protein